MPELVLVILIFIVAGATLMIGGLVAGKLLRPHNPSPEKGEIYECGEQSIGSAWVQFDLRFYVVALLFVIFEVELAFFFPWAVVFGSATRAADETQPAAVRFEAARSIQPVPVVETAVPAVPPDPAAMKSLAWIAFADIMVFFAVLMVGFAYLWKRGDLKWVRSTAAQHDSTPGTTVAEHAEV